MRGRQKISVERNDKVDAKTKQLKINSKIDIKDIDKEKIEAITEEILKLDFVFSINYEPKIAEIAFEGSILMTLNKEQSKEMVKQWKSKKVPDSIRIPIFNFIMTRCNIRALQLEEEMNLPTHIPMPRLSPQNQGQNTNNRSYVQ